MRSLYGSHTKSNQKNNNNIHKSNESKHLMVEFVEKQVGHFHIINANKLIEKNENQRFR